MDEGKNNSSRTPVLSFPFWVKTFPFFVSSFFFLSAFFTLFAPLPLLVLRLRKSGWFLFLSFATNASIVYLLGGLFSCILFSVLVFPLVLLIPKGLLTQRWSLEKVVGVNFVVILVLTALSGFLYYRASELHWFGLTGNVRETISKQFDEIATKASQDFKVDLPPEELKKNLLTELPSGILVFLLIYIWSNLMLFLNLNSAILRARIGISPHYFQTWKAPEYLVWPTLAAGASFVFGGGVLEIVGLNAFKFLMAIYAIQGLSILSYLFSIWGTPRLLRSVFYAVAVFGVLPLLLGIGFFDLWFDFRAKFTKFLKKSDQE